MVSQNTDIKTQLRTKGSLRADTDGKEIIKWHRPFDVSLGEDDLSNEGEITSDRS